MWERWHGLLLKEKSSHKIKRAEKERESRKKNRRNDRRKERRKERTKERKKNRGKRERKKGKEDIDEGKNEEKVKGYKWKREREREREERGYKEKKTKIEKEEKEKTNLLQRWSIMQHLTSIAHAPTFHNSHLRIIMHRKSIIFYTICANIFKTTYLKLQWLQFTGNREQCPP